MKPILSLFFLVIIESLQAQTINGKIIDDKTGEGIAYANIGIVGKYMGTVSNDDGYFELSINKLSDYDTLRVSIVTHISLDFLIKEIRTTNQPINIVLIEKTITLNEVVIRSRPKTAKTLRLGIEKKWCYPVPFNKRVTSNIRGFASYRGEEIGSYYPFDGNQHTLDSIQLNVYQAKNDTVKFRVNVYTASGESLLNKPIYVTLTKLEIMNSPIIDLSDHNLLINSDFIVAIENIEGIGDLTILVTFNAKGKKFKGMHRKNNQSDWELITNEGFRSGFAGISLLAFLNEQL